VDSSAKRRTGLGRLRAPRIPDDAPDEVLVAAMANGDDQAVVAFVRRYERRVYGLAWTMLGDPGLAEDVAQEAFVRAWQHAGSFDTRRGSASTWMLTIARNLAIDRIRLRRPIPVSPEQLGCLMGPVEDDDPSIRGERAAMVRSALALLPVDQRRALLLAAVYGYTAAEIGQAEAIPLGTAKTRIRSGLGKLRGILEHSKETW